MSDKLRATRDKFMAESVKLTTKPRFGLFSQPVSTAIGDDSYFHAKTAKKNDDGTVAIGPRNFYTNPGKKGLLQGSVFSKTSFTTVGDPYQDPGKLKLRTTQPNPELKATHEQPFKPSGPEKKEKYAPYEHMQDNVEKSKLRKNPDGSVPLEPKNFVTSPMKKGGANTTYGVLLEKKNKDDSKIADPYDRQKELARIERENHLKKMQEKPFSQRVHSVDAFVDVKATYGGGEELPHKKPAPKKEPEVHHDHPFKPSHPPKRGYNKTLASFPEYVPEQTEKIIKRNKEDEAKEKPPSWKPSHNNNLTRPTPPVVVHFKNIKSDFPSAFVR